MVWIRGYKQKKLISKISVDSNFTFTSYAWLCVFHCSHRLLCWRIKSRVRGFSVKIALVSYWNDFNPTLLGKCAFMLLRGVQHKYAKNSHFKNFESALYLTSVSMPLSNSTTSNYRRLQRSRKLLWLRHFSVCIYASFFMSFSVTARKCLLPGRLRIKRQRDFYGKKVPNL